MLQLGRPVIRRRARAVILAALAEADRPYGRTSGSAMRHRPIWRSFLLEQRALLRELGQVSAALPQIATPAAVISGNQDSMIPAATPAALLAAIRNCAGFELDGGHDLHLREPAAVAEVIAGFVTELPGYGFGVGSPGGTGTASDRAAGTASDPAAGTASDPAAGTGSA
jgi:pimeloyl-ACP methyl ester carboxylesterase